MTEVTIDQPAGNGGAEDEALREAGAAEGAAAVHAGQAETAAEQAEVAADMAEAATEAAMDVAEQVGEQAAQAEGAAVVAETSLEAVQAALVVQGAAIEHLTEELRLQRESQAAPAAPEPVSAPAEQAPKSRHWYYGR